MKSFRSVLIIFLAAGVVLSALSSIGHARGPDAKSDLANALHATLMTENDDATRLYEACVILKSFGDDKPGAKIVIDGYFNSDQQGGTKSLLVQ